MLNPKDYYYMKNDEGSGFFLVAKAFWRENGRIPDNEFDMDLLEGVLPVWHGEKTSGFSQEAEHFFKYFEGFKCKNKKGFTLLKEAGFVEIHWGEPG